jgi:hypothetical protein
MSIKTAASHEFEKRDRFGNVPTAYLQQFVAYLDPESAFYSAIDRQRWTVHFLLSRPLESGTTLGRAWPSRPYNNRPIEFDGNQLQITVEDLNPETQMRLESASRILDNLQKLPPGWDSYGANSISPKSIKTAFTIISAAILKGAPDPSIVPTPVGGIQLEWHNSKCDLEIEISDEEARAFFSLHSNPEQTWDGRLRSTGWHLDSLLARLR